jgi:hypothetical protein
VSFVHKEEIVVGWRRAVCAVRLEYGRIANMHGVGLFAAQVSDDA